MSDEKVQCRLHIAPANTVLDRVDAAAGKCAGQGEAAKRPDREALADTLDVSMLPDYLYQALSWSCDAYYDLVVHNLGDDVVLALWRDPYSETLDLAAFYCEICQALIARVELP